jgi:hypothetical protein
MYDLIMGSVQDLTNFGAAGLMGAMWLIERKLSRTREEQLGEAHKRICRDEEKLSCLTDVISRNTAAIVRLVQNQDHQCELLEHLLEEIHHKSV